MLFLHTGQSGLGTSFGEYGIFIYRTSNQHTQQQNTQNVIHKNRNAKKKTQKCQKKRYINIRHAKKRCKYDAPPILLVGLYTPQSATPVAAPRRHGSGLSAPGSGPRGCPDFRRIYYTIHIYCTYILSTIYIYTIITIIVIIIITIIIAYTLYYICTVYIIHILKIYYMYSIYTIIDRVHIQYIECIYI